MKFKLTENLETVISKDLIIPEDFLSTQVIKTIDRYDTINGPRHYELDFKNGLGIVMFVDHLGSQFKYLRKFERGGWYISESRSGKEDYIELLKNLENFISLDSNKLLYYVY